MKTKLKNILYLPVFAACMAACTVERKAKIEFAQKELSFSVAKDSVVLADFTFRNTGNDSLRILSADASCGCTALELPDKPVLPGDSGVIRIRYDNSSDKNSIIIKHIVLRANTTPALHTLTLLGNVKKRKL